MTAQEKHRGLCKALVARSSRVMAPLRPLHFVAAFLFAGCHPTREAPSPNPPVPPDTNLCPQMCEHIGPTLTGVPFFYTREVVA